MSLSRHPKPPAPKIPRRGIHNDRDEATKTGQNLVEQLQSARKLVEKGKGPKTIVKRTGLGIEEARSIYRAVKGIQQRKSHRERLAGLLKRFEAAMPLAEASFTFKPSAYTASCMSTISNEIRALMDHIDELHRPEQQALELIKDVVQPFVHNLLRDTTVEMRRARTECLGVAESPEAERAVRDAFTVLIREFGGTAKTRYSEMVERLGLALQCDLDELRKLARDSVSEEQAQAEVSEKVKHIEDYR